MTRGHAHRCMPTAALRAPGTTSGHQRRSHHSSQPTAKSPRKRARKRPHLVPPLMRRSRSVLEQTTTASTRPRWRAQTLLATLRKEVSGAGRDHPAIDVAAGLRAGMACSKCHKTSRATAGTRRDLGSWLAQYVFHARCPVACANIRSTRGKRIGA